MYNFAVNLDRNSNLGVVNSCALFKVRLNLTIKASTSKLSSPSTWMGSGRVVKEPPGMCFFR